MLRVYKSWQFFLLNEKTGRFYSQNATLVLFRNRDCGWTSWMHPLRLIVIQKSDFSSHFPLYYFFMLWGYILLLKFWWELPECALFCSVVAGHSLNSCLILFLIFSFHISDLWVYPLLLSMLWQCKTSWHLSYTAQYKRIIEWFERSCCCYWNFWPYIWV